MSLDVVDGSRIIYNGVNYRFRERRGEHLDWVSERTRDLVTFTDSELLERTSDGTIIFHHPGIRYDSETHLEIAGDPNCHDGSHSVLGGAPRADTANQMAGKDRLAYVKEIVSEGLHLTRSLKDLSVLSARVAKERGDKIAPAAKTLLRWLDLSGNAPIAKRLGSLHHLKGNRTRRYGPEVLAIIDEVIEEKFLVPEPIPKNAIRPLVIAEIRKRNSTRTADILPEPGHKVIRNQIARLRAEDILRAQKGKTHAYSKEGHAVEIADPARPLERVEIDHTVLDLIVVDPANGLPLGRPTLAVAIDRCTRMPFGIHISFDPPSLLTVMECLKNGMLAKSYLEIKKADPEHPWNITKDWPVAGIPHSLVVDLARENVSDDLRNFAFSAGINEVHFMPRRSPWFKGAVERFIGTINRQVAHTTPGTTFSNTLAKGDYASVDHAVVSLNQIYEALHKWMVDIYQFNPHNGIRRTPRSLWDEVTRKHRIRFVTDRRLIDDHFGRSERSSMRRTGIKLQHLTYQSAEYGNFRDSEECRKLKGADGKIPFLYDPADLSQVRIKRKNGDILYVPISRKWENYAKGLSIWQHRAITAYLNTENRAALEEDDFVKAKAELYEMMRNLGTKRTKGHGKRSNAKAERYAGTARRAYSADSTDIHVEGLGDQPIFAVVEPDPRPLAPSGNVPNPRSTTRSNNVVPLSNNLKGLPARPAQEEYDPYATRGPKNG